MKDAALPVPPVTEPVLEALKKTAQDAGMLAGEVVATTPAASGDVGKPAVAAESTAGAETGATPSTASGAVPVVWPRANILLRLAGKLYLRLIGWKAVGGPPPVPKVVFIAAPHTSNWDLPHALAVAWALGIRISWAGKSSLFRFPFGPFMRWLGGISIERSRRENQVQKIAEAIAKCETICLVIAPSGTRSKLDHWKSGFYHIARTANIPVLPAFLDFGRKQGGTGPLIYLSGDVRADMDKIRAFYDGMTGKNPDQETPRYLKEELRQDAS